MATCAVASGLKCPPRAPRQQRSLPLRSTRPRKSVDTSDFPPPPNGGRGEWADWDNEAYVGDGSDMGGLFGGDDGGKGIPIKAPATLPADAAGMAAGSDDSGEDVDVVVQRLRDAAARSRAAGLSDDDDTDIPPPPPGSRGEWSDWSGGASSSSSSFSSSSSSSSGRNGAWSPRQDREEGGRSASENWEGWSEDAPYFDEAEVVDDEGNRGHATDDRPQVNLGSSDLWMTRAERAAMSRESEPPPPAAVESPAPVAASSPGPPTVAAPAAAGVPADAALTIVVEMNRQFQLLDAKTAALTAEVASLKTLLALALGAMAVLLAKDGL